MDSKQKICCFIAAEGKHGQVKDASSNNRNVNSKWSIRCIKENYNNRNEIIISASYGEGVPQLASVFIPSP